MGKVMSEETGICPECNGEVSLPDGIGAGEIVHCPDCGAELEVRSLTPVVLARASQSI
jgi:alpha-aminoadipate carrier protein LysW